MPDNTITLVLDGKDVPLTTFKKAVDHFQQLVEALSAEIGATSLDWVVQELSVSSTMASVASYGPAELVERVVTGYSDVGAALEAGSPINHVEPVRKAARGLAGIRDGRTKVIRMETAARESIIPLEPRPRQKGQLIEMPAAIQATKVRPTFGTIRGRIQTLTNRGSLRFTLYDLNYDKAVSCYFAEGKEESIKGLWGKLAAVEGMVSRDPVSGRPLSIRKVANLTPIPEPGNRFDYQEARGCAPSLSGLSPEDAIRKIRDAQ